MPANGAVTAKPRHRVAAAALRAAQQAQAVGRGTHGGHGLVALGLRAQEVLARDDLVGAELLGAFEVSLGDALFGLRLDPLGMRRAHFHAVQRGQRLPGAHTIAELGWCGGDAAFDAWRDMGHTVLVGHDGGGGHDRLAERLRLHGLDLDARALGLFGGQRQLFGLAVAAFLFAGVLCTFSRVLGPRAFAARGECDGHRQGGGDCREPRKTREPIVQRVHGFVPSSGQPAAFSSSICVAWYSASASVSSRSASSAWRLMTS